MKDNGTKTACALANEHVPHNKKKVKTMMNCGSVLMSKE
jgi:hypothetical protein